MIVLGIDTATRFAGVAVVADGAVVAEARGGADGRGADLLVLVEAVCIRAAIGARDLDAVAIGAGPGSFTSLRIGMATAKGIAFAAARPLWAVSSLAALAYAELAADPSGVVVGVLDARRGEVYAGAFRRDGERVVAIGDERVLPPAELAAFGAAAGATRYAGDATYPALAALPGAWDRTPSGVAVALLALAGARADVLVTGVPAYIRPAEAELKYPDGVPGALPRRRE